MARTLERYVLLEVARTFAFTVLLALLVFLVASTARFVYDGVSYGTLIRVIPFVLPYSLPYVLPIALLVATTLAVGRLVQDSEVVALRASGFSAWVIARPILLLAATASLAVLWLESSIVPYCHWKKKDIQKVFIEEFLGTGEGTNLSFRFPMFHIFIRERSGHDLRGVQIHRTEHDQPVTLTAERGRIEIHGEMLLIVLQDVQVTAVLTERADEDEGDGDGDGAGEGGREAASAEGAPPAAPPSRLADVLELRFAEYRQDVPLAYLARNRIEFSPSGRLLARLAEVERALAETPPSSEPPADLVRERRQVRTELHSRWALPMACLALALIGVPLPLLLEGRGGRLAPLLIGFLLSGMLLFAPFLALKTLAWDGVTPVVPSLWAGPALASALGLGLLLRAVRR